MVEICLNEKKCWHICSQNIFWLYPNKRRRQFQQLKSSNILQNICSNQRDEVIKQQEKKHLEKNPTKPFWRYIKVYIRFITHKLNECAFQRLSRQKKISQRGTLNQRIKRNCIQFTDDFEGKRSKPHHVQSTNKCCSPRHVRNWAGAAGLLFIKLINKCFLWMWIVLSVDSKIQTFVSGCLFHSVTTPSLFPVWSVFWRVGGT